MKIFLNLLAIFLILFKLLLNNFHLIQAEENFSFDRFWNSNSAEKNLEISEENSEEENKIFEEKEQKNEEKIKKINLQTYCFGNGKVFQLGSCSSTFLKCEEFNNRKQSFSFEECPLGQVFIGKKCKPARRVKDCFLPQVNLLNDATEKLAQAVHFCDRHRPFTPTIYFFDGNSPKEKCSRQALLCRGSAVKPLAISCPPGKILLMNNMTCIKSPEHCINSISEKITPIKNYLLNLFCDEYGEENAPLFPQSLFKATEGRCRNWYAVCEETSEPEFVFCDGGKIFDKQKELCRRILPEDQCPHFSACRQHLFKNIFF